jgi:DNA-binding NarL/FixJ family response regulator
MPLSAPTKVKTSPTLAARTTATLETTSPTSTKMKVLIVDDHPITRQGMKALINQQLNLEVCGEADNAAQAIDMVGKLQPNLPILVVSMHDEALYAERALRAGAMGYVMKQDAGEKVATAIEHLLRGEIYLSAKMKEKMLHRFVNKKSDGMVFAIDTLSDREMEVFHLIGNGYSTRQIAQKLNLSSKTIDSYREHLKLKLSLDSGAELVRYAIQWARHEMQ